MTTAVRMTGRYSRKTVPLEVRGISRDRLETGGHPLPDAVDDALYYPGYGDAEYAYRHPSDSSGRTSPEEGESEATRSWLSMSLGGTTGNTTERSSIFSLGEDEFDRQASRRVRSLFEQIDAMLFERRHGPKHLLGECKEWVTAFPHLRVLGAQLMSPQDVGFQIISTDSAANTTSGSNLLMDVTDHDISTSHSVNELAVMGQHVDAHLYPVDHLVLSHRGDDDDDDDDSTGELALYEEEVIEQDGCVEDIIAVDYKASEEDIKSTATHRRKKRGYPPITPQACVKDNISGAAFDFIWSETISWLRQVLHHYAEDVILDRDDEEDDVLEQQLVVGYPLAGIRDLPFNTSRESSLLLMSSRLPDKMNRLGSTLNPPEGFNSLEGLLTISSKALQSRERSNLHEQTDSALGTSLAMVRPGSSFKHPGGRPGSVRQRLPSAGIRGAGRMRLLAPLERVKTPSDEDKQSALHNEVLRGHRLYTMSEQVSPPPPPLNFTRNGALPPIALERLESSPTPPPASLNNNNNTTIPKKKISVRASSAVHDKESRILMKDRDKAGLGAALEARPSTTHALYRSETPLVMNRRSSTPLGYTNMLRISHGTPQLGTSPAPGASQLTGNLNLNITGSSINPHTESGHSHGADLDDEDQLDELHSRWEPPHRKLLSSNLFKQLEGASNLPTQIRRGKQPHYMPVR